MAGTSLPPSPSRRKLTSAATPKTPGSLAHAAAFRSLQRRSAHQEPSLLQAAASLGQRGARFLYLCDHGDCDYSRPLHEPHYKGGYAPRWTKRWPHWRDVLDEIAFADVRRPSTDHWGREVRHLPIGIEPASLNCTVLDVDIYNVPDLKLLVQRAPPAAINVSRNGVHLWYNDPAPPFDYDTDGNYHAHRKNFDWSWRGLSGEMKGYHGFVRVFDLVELQVQLVDALNQRTSFRFPDGFPVFLEGFRFGKNARATGPPPNDHQDIPLADSPVHQSTVEASLRSAGATGRGSQSASRSPNPVQDPPANPLPSRRRVNEAPTGTEAFGSRKRAHQTEVEEELKSPPLGGGQAGVKTFRAVPGTSRPDHIRAMIPDGLGWRASYVGRRHVHARAFAASLMAMPRNWNLPLEDVVRVMRYWNNTIQCEPLPISEVDALAKWIHKTHTGKPIEVHVVKHKSRAQLNSHLGKEAARIKGRLKGEKARAAYQQGGREEARSAAGVHRVTLNRDLAPGYSSRARRESRDWAISLATQDGWEAEHIHKVSETLYKRHAPRDSQTWENRMTLGDLRRAFTLPKEPEERRAPDDTPSNPHGQAMLSLFPMYDTAEDRGPPH